METAPSTTHLDASAIAGVSGIAALRRVTRPAHVAAPVADELGERWVARRTLERESNEVLAALLAVSKWRSLRVVVCNLVRPAVVVESLRGVAAELGLDLELVGIPDGPGFDVAVRAR